MIATSIVKNKYWIVEDGGNKVATIQAVDEGGVAYVHNNEREIFPSIKILQKKYNIAFVTPKKPKKVKLDIYTVHGYPTNSLPHNEVLDVKRYLPIYTKGAKSKSFYCAGYYIIKFSNSWIKSYCPKLITLNRYEYVGPFKTAERQTDALKEANSNVQ